MVERAEAGQQQGGVATFFSWAWKLLLAVLAIAGAARFATDAKLARAAGLAPIPISSGKTNRHRLDRGGNRQINAAIHRIAITRARCDPETQAYITRKRSEGKTTREAIRSLKRHLARRIWHLLQPPLPTRTETLTSSLS